MRYLIPIVMLLGGCTGLSEMIKSKGTHDYSVSAEGDVSVKVDSVLGGPHLTVTTDKDGGKTIDITPAERRQWLKQREAP